MAIGRPIKPVVISPEVRKQLEAVAHSRSHPHGLVRRAKIILLAADGQSSTAIAKTVNLSKAMVGMWRKRFLSQGMTGLYDEPRSGGPRSISDARIARLLRKTTKTKPQDGTYWTCRSIAAEAKISKSTVQRVWKAFSLQPHRQKHFDHPPISGPVLTLKVQGSG